MTTEPHVHICSEEKFPITLGCGCQFNMTDAECFEMRQCALHAAVYYMYEALLMGASAIEAAIAALGNPIIEHPDGTTTDFTWNLSNMHVAACKAAGKEYDGSPWDRQDRALIEKYGCVSRQNHEGGPF